MKAVTVTHDLQIGWIELQEPHFLSAGEFVGGFIKIVRPQGLKRPYVMLVNESFLHKRLPRNEIGCYLYKTHLHGNPICGNILILREEGEDLVGLKGTELLKVTGAMLKVKDILASETKTKG